MLFCRVKFLYLLILLAFLACGGPISREGFSEDPLFFSPQAPQDRIFYSQGDVIDMNHALPPLDHIEGIEVMGGVENHCYLNENSEYSCGFRMKETPQDESAQFKNAIEVKQSKIYFNQTGIFLVKAIKTNHSEKIFRIFIGGAASGFASSAYLSEFEEIFDEFKVYRYYDSIYSMISHFELRSLFSRGRSSNPRLTPLPYMDVRWEVRGGRYHIFETELPSFSALQPFQKSILFQEREKYEVKAIVSIQGSKGNIKNIEKSVIVDLRYSGEKESDARISTRGVSLDIQKIEGRVNQPIKAWGGGVPVEAQTSGIYYQWEVRKIKQRQCPDTLIAFENQHSIPVQMALQRICQGFYEETMIPGREYDLEGKGSKDASLVFKEPGKYAVIFVVLDRGGEVLDRATRTLNIQNMLFSHTF